LGTPALAFVVAALYFRALSVCANRPGHTDHVSSFQVGYSPGALDRAHRGCVSDGHCDVHHFRRGELGYRRQVIDLADKLPDYQANIVAKIRSLKLPAGGPLARFSSSVHVLQSELAAPSPAPSMDRARGDLRPERLRLWRVLSR